MFPDMAILLHVDMDAFFASVEQLRHSAWRGKPVIVGAPPDARGVVSTCSYEARAFGVRSAMPSRTAYTLCPHGIFVAPDMAAYKAVSQRAFDIFGRYSPFVEAVSIDEAFLDITGTIHLHGSAQALGEHLKAAIRQELGVTCSVGIAPNRLLAKIGSDLHKPDGLSLMPFEPDAIAAFLAPRPVTILWGVGHKAAERLNRVGVMTCGDLQRLSIDRLESLLGSRSQAEALHAHAFGVASDRVSCDERIEKSISREHTFGEDVTNRKIVRSTLLELVRDVAAKVRREKRWATVAHLKLRDASFATVTRQRPFDTPARDDMTFREAALALFDALWVPGDRRQAVRLVGFGVSRFSNEATALQDDFFTPSGAAAKVRRENLSEALDRLHDRGLM